MYVHTCIHMCIHIYIYIYIYTYTYICSATTVEAQVADQIVRKRLREIRASTASQAPDEPTRLQRLAPLTLYNVVKKCRPAGAAQTVLPGSRTEVHLTRRLFPGLSRSMVSSRV